jgi:hypothetical protein
MASVAPAVTPVPGTSYQMVTGGASQVAVAAGPNGGFITNPVLATDQGIGAAEVLYVNPYGNATTSANNTTFALQPGQTWNIIPGQTTATSVNAITTGHQFSAVSY